MIEHRRSDDSIVNLTTYSYDDAGNRIGALEHDGTVTTWTYDDTYQLTREQRSGTGSFDVSYSYDAAGNRTLQDDSGALTTYTYDAANRLLTESSSTGLTTYTYDDDGNRTQKDTPSDITYYTWDEDGRLTSAEPVAGPVTFSYNADGRRVEKETPSETTRFVYDGNKLLQETDGSGSVEQQYVSTLEEWGELVSGYDGLETSTYHYDAIGTTDALLDEDETATDRYRHRAFGAEQSHTGSSENPFTFVGRQGYYRDEELALYLAGARYYDPAAGRWLSQDPIRFDGGDANLYRYVKNNPVNAVDPSGLQEAFKWRGPGDLLNTLSIPITFGTTKSFLAGVAEGFIVEGLWETAKGVKAVVVGSVKGIGRYLYFAGSYWTGGLDSASRTSVGQSIDAATTATLKYGPMVATIAGDLPILTGTRKGDLSPETETALQTAAEVLPQILAAVKEELATMPDEQKAKLAGTLLGVVTFEVALAAATAGAGTALSAAAKSGKLAGITQKLSKVASPALVRKLQKILDSVLDRLHNPKGQQTKPAKSKSVDAPPPAARVDKSAPASQPPRPTAEAASAVGEAAAPDSAVNQIRRSEFGGLEGVSQRQLPEFGNAIAGNSRAASLYRQISNAGTHVDFNFGPLRRTSSGGVISGQFDNLISPGHISVYARAQRTVGDAVGTFAHEARHAIDARRGLRLGTQGSEYRAFVEEFIVRKGRVPVRSEMGTLAREVQRLYPSLPTDSRVIRISGY